MNTVHVDSPQKTLGWNCAQTPTAKRARSPNDPLPAWRRNALAAIPLCVQSQGNLQKKAQSIPGRVDDPQQIRTETCARFPAAGGQYQTFILPLTKVGTLASPLLHQKKIRPTTDEERSLQIGGTTAHHSHRHRRIDS